MQIIGIVRILFNAAISAKTLSFCHLDKFICERCCFSVVVVDFELITGWVSVCMCMPNFEYSPFEWDSLYKMRSKIQRSKKLATVRFAYDDDVFFLY